MWSFLVGFLLASITSTTAVTRFLRDPNSVSVLPRGFIVELDHPGDLANFRYEKRDIIPGTHEHFKRELSIRDVHHHLRYEYNDPRIFVGASVVLHNHSDLHQLISISGVRAVSPIELYPIPRTKATVVDPKNGKVDRFMPHIMTGVDKLHAEGYLGKGVTVGVLDTGVDYHHPSLGGGIGPKYPIIGGWDFVGDDYTGSNTPQPDDDPYSACAGHGTHVTGTIVANDKALQFTGVVPEAKVWMGRVFGCNGSVSNDVTIAAMEKAFIEAKVDVISMSLGGASGWIESPDSVVASRISGFGVPVVIANGNDGSYGLFYPSSPGTALADLAVGSVENAVLSGFITTPSDNSGKITYLSVLPWMVSKLELYATAKSLNDTADACDPLPDTTPDLSDKVTLIGRGNCTFVTKFANAQAKGAKYVMIFNNAGTPLYLPDFANITSAFLLRADGLRLLSAFFSKKHITLDFTDRTPSGIPNPVGSLMSDFSNYGPDFNMHLKPAISAPGGNILSTWPLSMGGYTIISGTSMATPFIAGSLALIKSARRGIYFTTAELRALLASTATPVASSYDKTHLQTVSQQGAGLVNVYNAVHADTFVSPSALLLNDTANFKGQQVITIKNIGKIASSWKLSNVPADTVNTFVDGTYSPAGPPLEVVDGAAKVTFPKGNTVQVKAGQTIQVPINFVQPKVKKAASYPLYSGFIVLQNMRPGGKDYRVPYLGLVGSLQDIPLLDDSATNAYVFSQLNMTFPDLFDLRINASVSDSTPSFKLGKAINCPQLRYRINMGSPFISIDYVSGNMTMDQVHDAGDYAPLPTKSKRLDLRRLHKRDSRKRGHRTPFTQVPVVGNFITYEYQPRNVIEASPKDNGYNVESIDGSLQFGGNVTDGTYKMLIRVQRLNTIGDAQEDFDAWLSPAFAIARTIEKETDLSDEDEDSSDEDFDTTSLYSDDFAMDSDFDTDVDADPETGYFDDSDYDSDHDMSDD